MMENDVYIVDYGKYVGVKYRLDVDELNYDSDTGKISVAYDLLTELPDNDSDGFNEWMTDHITQLFTNAMREYIDKDID